MASHFEGALLAYLTNPAYDGLSHQYMASNLFYELVSLDMTVLFVLSAADFYPFVRAPQELSDRSSKVLALVADLSNGCSFLFYLATV